MMTKQAKKHQTLLNMLLENMTTVAVAFAGSPGRTYTYKAPKHWDLKVGDDVVVDSPSGGMTVVKVVEVHKAPQLDADADFQYKWLVQKVDRSGHDAQLERERLFLEQLAEVERVHVRAETLTKATEALGKDTEAARAFQAAVAGLTGEPVQTTAASTAEASTAS